MEAPLNARKVLIVEDEALVAMLIEDNLLDFGCEVVGIAATVKEALGMLQVRSQIDVAVLDMNLSGHSTNPIATALASRGVPYLFVTGYGNREQLGAPVVSKPFTSESLKNGLLAALG